MAAPITRRRRRAPLVPKFLCDFCGYETVSDVLDTRGPRRRRRCRECGDTFPTVEVRVAKARTPLHYGRKRQPSLFDDSPAPANARRVRPGHYS